MGNHGGVRREGLTLEEVRDALQSFTSRHFEGVLSIEHEGANSSKGYGHVGLVIEGEENEDKRYILVWWDNSSHNPGFIGGNHPRIGAFGYWLLAQVELFVAAAVKGRPYDEGVGDLNHRESPSFPAWIDNSYYGVSSTARAFWKLTLRKSEREWLHESLWPWFDGDNTLE